MKERISSTHKLLSSLLAALLLLVAVAGKSWSVERIPVKKQQTEKSHSSENSDQGTTAVSELSLHAVVTPALSFDFVQSWLVLPQAVLFYFEQKVPIPLSGRTPFYYFSYFRNIFGHYIAPNAP